MNELDCFLKLLKDYYYNLGYDLSKLNDLESISKSDIEIKKDISYDDINDYIYKLINKYNDDLNLDRIIICGQLLSIYINFNLSFSNNNFQNLQELKKLNYLYEIINSQQDIIEINSYILKNNKLFTKIVKSIINNNSEKDKYLMLIIDSYSNVYQNDIIDLLNCYDNNLSNYFNDLKNIPAIDEIEYENLMKKAKQGDIESRKRFIEANLKLVVSIANNYKNKYRDFGDLIQNGNEGLIIAYEKFDLSKGCKFSTYATWWIRKKVIEFIQNKYIIRIPNMTYVKYYKVIRYKKYLEENGIVVTPKLLSEKTGFSLQQINNILNIPFCFDSLDAPINIDEENGNKAGDFISSNYKMEINVENIILKEDINKIINKYFLEHKTNKRDINIFLRHLGFNGKKENFDEIGNDYLISRQRAHQIYKNILNGLLEYFKNNSDNLYFEDEGKIFS